MAQNTAVHLLDDLNGEPAEETVRFSLDGVEYDIDLSAENAQSLRDTLGTYLQHGRRTGGRKRAARIIELPKPAGKKKSTKKSAKAEISPRKAATKKTAPAKAPEKKTTSSKASVTKSTSTTAKATSAAAKNVGRAKTPRKAPVVRFSSPT